MYLTSINVVRALIQAGRWIRDGFSKTIIYVIVSLMSMKFCRWWCCRNPRSVARSRTSSWWWGHEERKWCSSLCRDFITVFSVFIAFRIQNIYFCFARIPYKFWFSVLCFRHQQELKLAHACLFPMCDGVTCIWWVKCSLLAVVRFS
jgi:hypothetical protein